MPENTSSSASGSNKLMYIIGGVVVLLLIGWLVTRGASGAAGVDMDRNVDGSTTYTDDQGNSATVGATSYPENWPSDVPRYENATLQYSGSSNPQTGATGAAVMFQTSDSAQTVVDFYKAQLAANGWTIAGTANANGAMVLTATKDTRNFGVWAAPAGDGKVMVTAGLGM